MNTKMKLILEEAIQKAVNDCCENEDIIWEYYLHPELSKQMADAAEAVFDACQDAQKYYEHENV